MSVALGQFYFGDLPQKWVSFQSALTRKRFLDLIPSAEVERLAGTSHFLPMERPDAVRDAVRQAVS